MNAAEPEAPGLNPPVPIPFGPGLRLDHAQCPPAPGTWQVDGSSVAWAAPPERLWAEPLRRPHEVLSRFDPATFTAGQGVPGRDFMFVHNAQQRAALAVALP